MICGRLFHLNDVTAMIRKAKKLYVSESIVNNEENINNKWKSLRSIMPRKANANFIQKMSRNNEEIVGSKCIASCLMTFLLI